jgi:hypothetical protein
VVLDRETGEKENQITGVRTRDRGNSVLDGTLRMVVYYHPDAEMVG